MGYNRFYLGLALHCLLILATAYLFFYFLEVREQASTAAGMAFLSLGVTLRLVWMVNRTNRLLAHYLSYLRESDPSLYYTIKRVDSNFKGLHSQLELLVKEFKEQRIDLEVQAHYLEAILDNVHTGIVSFEDGGEIRTMNQAARDYLGSERIAQLGELDKRDPGLGKILRELPPGEQVSKSMHRDGRELNLLLHRSVIRLKAETLHIVAIQDITHQMEEQEIASWKKLIRVINHEIMNSMTPIITLAMAIHRKITRVEDARESASIIEERSKGLVSFIERYKKLTQLPAVKPARFAVDDLFEQVRRLHEAELREMGIELECHAGSGQVLEADRQMMEQVLINLVRNAAHALRHSKEARIRLLCEDHGEEGLSLTVEDNGEGIPPEKLEQVFVPFFSTREDGSGIGLSLCRQIIRMHRGQISLQSTPEEGTRVLISLP